MTTLRRRTVLLLAVTLVASCAAREVLLPKSASVPAGTDLSGQWLLRSESLDTIERLRDAELAAAGGPASLIDMPQSRNARGGRDSLVHVFLEAGRQLKITQTDYGLFISFDRAIVEEYRFGENRRVSVGPVMADRVSGWEDGGYVIETLGPKGHKLRERYQLADEGSLLLRQITVYERDAITLSLVQKFDRI